MSNFNIFNTDQVQRLIKPFSDGMSDHITPIKFEAITPDIFAFLFRTTSVERKQHYFVSLEFDHMESVDAASAIIEKWHGASVKEFWTPTGIDAEGDPRVTIDDTYYALFAEVERPAGEGYWAKNVVVKSRDDIYTATEQLPEEQRNNVRDGLTKIFIKHPKVMISYYINENGTVDYVYQ